MVAIIDWEIWDMNLGSHLRRMIVLSDVRVVVPINIINMMQYSNTLSLLLLLLLLYLDHYIYISSHLSSRASSLELKI